MCESNATEGIQQNKRIQKLEAGLRAILREHGEDVVANPGHCLICGAADGYWPCVTVIEARAALGADGD